MTIISGHVVLVSSHGVMTASLSGTLPPNSARTGYATEGALFISAQLSTYAVGALRKVPVLIQVIGLLLALGCFSLAPKHELHKHETQPPRVNKKQKSSVSIQTIVVLFVLV